MVLCTGDCAGSPSPSSCVAGKQREEEERGPTTPLEGTLPVTKTSVVNLVSFTESEMNQEKHLLGGG